MLTIPSRSSIGRSKIISKLLREPLVHFLLIGVAVFIVYGLLAPKDNLATDTTVVVDQGEIEWMQTTWQKRWNRPPTKQELDGLIDQYVRETILYREALAMGLDQDDPIIRRRMAQKMDFLAQDLAVMNPPTEQELRQHFKDNMEAYKAPSSYTFTQIFFDPDKRGGTTLDDA